MPIGVTMLSDKLAAVLSRYDAALDEACNIPEASLRQVAHI
jgi:hypothetical protein